MLDKAPREDKDKRDALARALVLNKRKIRGRMEIDDDEINHLGIDEDAF